MSKTYEPIATTVLTSTASFITFSSLPQTYTDLVLVVTGDVTGSGWAGLVIQLNGDTSTNYSETYLYGDGSSAASTRASSQTYLNLGAISNVNPSPNIFEFQSYSNTNVFKTILASSGITDGWVKRGVGLWRSTSAINSIKVYHPSLSLEAGTTASLFGIKAKSPVLPLLTESTKTTSSVSAIIGNYDAGLTYTLATTAGTATRSGDTITVSGLTTQQTITLTVTATDGNSSSSSNTISLTSSPPPRAEGGTVTESGGYRIHTFTSSGTFTVNDGGFFEYLVIAGGGGGGGGLAFGYNGGGGGAGGYRTNVSGQPSGGGASAEGSLNLPATTYPITIGAGGTGGAGYSSSWTKGSNGSASSFSTISCTGGGGGGKGGQNVTDVAGSPGGSGGGAGSSATVGSSTPGGSGTSGQGYAGSGSTNPNSGSAGSGGGAGGAGVKQNSNPTGVAGGAGVASIISGSSVTRAIGGAVKAYDDTNFSNAPSNSGSGGHGAASNATVDSGASGGSGVVIIRYPV